MSADLLREAAALMRERAEDVAEESGLARTAPVKYPLWFEATDDYRDMGNATHGFIASWHPAVALAVADWLDHEAETFEFVGATFGAPAFAVARAYLGRDV